MILPFPSTFETAHWLVLCIFYVFLGAIVNLFISGALLIASFVSIGVFLAGILATFRLRKREIESEARAREIMARELIRQLKRTEGERLSDRARTQSDGGTEAKSTHESTYSGSYPREEESSIRRTLIIIAALIVFGIVFLIFVAPQLWKSLSDFAGYLVSDSGVVATFVVLTSSTVTCAIMLIVIFLYLPTSVVKEINKKKMEFGILGTVLFTISNILVLVEGMQGVSAHYPQLVSVAIVGMAFSVACMVCSWAMCSFLLTKGIQRRNISHLFLAITIGIYAAITMLYASAELLALIFGLGTR
jgi:hypothetical protein